MQTGAAAINTFGKIAGDYVDADGAYHGFLRDRRGRFTTVDMPGAMATQPTDTNDLDQVVGSYSTTARHRPQAPTRAGSCSTGAGSPRSTSPAPR